ncbi:MAG: MraY family glycosyltransferase, partial [Pseudomonadota bacterium]
RLGLDYRIKLTGQILGACVFIFAADVQITRLPFFFDGEMPGWAGLPLTLLVIVGVTNAVNMSDGMDGLAGGNSLLAACALGYLIYLGGDKQITLLALSVIGATLGFLRYNTYPARIFMGDAGSQFLGFSVAALALLLIEKCNTAVSPLTPLLLLALPIIDTIQVVVARVRAGASPFNADRRHLHHQLLDAGLSQYQVVILIYGLQLLLIAMTWELLYAPDIAIFATFLIFAISLIALVNGWRSQYRQGKVLFGSFHAVNSFVGFLRENDILALTGRYGVLYGITLLFPVLAIGVQRVEADIGWLALMLLLIVAVSLWGRFQNGSAAIIRLPAYATSVVLAYLAFDEGLRFGMSYQGLILYLFGLALLIALWIRFGSQREFRLNALDLLIIPIVVVTPNLPVVGEAGLGATVLASLLLFYACELVLSENPRFWFCFKLAISSALALLVVRGFLI